MNTLKWKRSSYHGRSRYDATGTVYLFIIIDGVLYSKANPAVRTSYLRQTRRSITGTLKVCKAHAQKMEASSAVAS